MDGLGVHPELFHEPQCPLLFFSGATLAWESFQVAGERGNTTSQTRLRGRGHGSWGECWLAWDA